MADLIHDPLGIVNLIELLSNLVFSRKTQAEHAKAQHLLETWRDHWNALGKDEFSVASIDHAINDLRQDVLRVMHQLE